MTDAQETFDVDLRVINYPGDGTRSALRTVAFGPASPDIALLIEVGSGEVPRVTYTIGNGPENEALASEVSEMLHEMADLLADAGGEPEFLAAVAEASATE